jgi:hypothetical protein
MDSLTNEDTLLSVSRMPRVSASERHDSRSATPTGEKPILDTSDNLDAIQEVKYKADDGASAPQGGAHRSYSISVHVLIFPPICEYEREIRGSGSP